MEEKMRNSNIRIFLDMDGMLVNLVDQLTPATIKEIQASKNLEVIQEYFWETVGAPLEMGLTSAYLNYLFYKRDTEGHNRIEKLIFDHSFSPLLNNEAIWVRMKPYTYARDLVAFCVLKVGAENVRILSAPTDAASILGKNQWIQQHMPEFLEYAIYDRNKSKYIQEGYHNFLIDDRPKNIQNWRDAGGFGILHRPMYPYWTRTKLSKALEILCNGVS